MEKQILEIYKNRLINFGGRNQTLCRNKLYAIRAFDLLKLDKITPNATKEILELLLKNSDKEKKILLRSTEIQLTRE